MPLPAFRSRTLNGFISAQGFVVFQVDEPPELGTITFAGPRDWNPTWCGMISQQTRTKVIARFHRLAIEARAELFGL